MRSVQKGVEAHGIRIIKEGLWYVHWMREKKRRDSSEESMVVGLVNLDQSSANMKKNLEQCWCSYNIS